MRKPRVIIIFLFVAGLWGAMLTRGAYLQLIPNPKLEKIKKKQFKKMVRLSSRRGDILDRNGQELAVSMTSYSLFADPKIIKDPYAVAKRLSRFLGVSFRSVYNKIKSRKKRFVWIRRKMDEKSYEKIRKWGIRGLAFKEEFRRVYPHKTLASQLIGFVGREQQGLGGLEKNFEKVLSGNGKRVSVQRDARGRALVEDGRIFTQTPEGSDVYLTIDKDLQYWVEKELENTAKKHKAPSAWAVVLDPENSEILAMATYPFFDSNKGLKTKMARQRNKTIHDVYEMGSVMKAFTVAGALKHELVEPNTRINTENGVFRIGKRKITEADSKHNFPSLTVSEVLAYSSNVGVSKIALKMTDKVLHQTLREFGFGEKSGVGIPGEARGILSKPPWRKHLTANISFGHGVAVTALQVANAYAAIANGGKLHRPYIIKEIRDVDSGEVIQTDKKEIRQVLSEKDAQTMKMMLSSVVARGGSGFRARIDGYPVAGKTGTAQRVSTDGRGYEKGAYLSSFAGFVPANDPRYVIYVAVDKPRNGYYASTIAAPAFRSIARYALRRERAAPVYVSHSDLVMQNKDEAKEVELKSKTVNLADVDSELTAPGKMPSLKGMTLTEVMKELRGKDLRVKIEGKGKVSRTYPAAGTPLKKNSRIRLHFQ